MNHFTSLADDRKWSKELSTIGDKLGDMSLSKDVLLTSVVDLVNYLHTVDQPPSKVIQTAMVPIVTFLGEHRLLNHKDKKERTESWYLPLYLVARVAE